MNFRERMEFEFRLAMFPVQTPETKEPKRESLFGDRDLTLAQLASLIQQGRTSVRKIKRCWWAK